MKTNRNERRALNFEAMEKRELFAADLGMDFAIATAAPETQALLLPAVQKFHEPTDGSGGFNGGVFVASGDVNNGAARGLLLPAVQKPRDTGNAAATDHVFGKLAERADAAADRFEGRDLNPQSDPAPINGGLNRDIIRRKW